jgi:hypothetical protein
MSLVAVEAFFVMMEDGIACDEGYKRVRMVNEVDGIRDRGSPTSKSKDS